MRRAVKRFNVATLTVAILLVCLACSLVIYTGTALLFDGKVRWFAIFMTLFIPSLVAPPIIVLLLNLTRSLDRAQEELQHTSRQLRVLSHRLLEVQETERRTIALELHDEVGQALTALKIGLRRTQGSKTLESALASTAENMPTVEELIRKVRNLSIELRPPILDDFGLATSLDWYVKRLSSRAEFRAEFHTNVGEGRFSPLLELTCFRIAQEALTNASRHSDAQKVRVELEACGGELHLAVMDDGKGFDTFGKALSGESLGLLGMRERVTLAGGRMELLSAPGQGTEIHCFFQVGPKGQRQEG